MDNFKELIISSALSTMIQDYPQIEKEGKDKKESCRYYYRDYCVLFRVRGDTVSVWTSGERMDPHPVVCYVCPYYYSHDEEKVIDFSLSELYIYYYNQEKSIERELEWLEDRIKRIGSMAIPIGLIRRREGLLSTLNDMRSKRRIVTIIMRLSRKI
ncbi:hypothetical protein HS7_11020 [Sulfolobales archaeon HS-7]|nr:hypothetical protein HS7_11020 [Sulfolobales archaeon HS-7]